MFFVPRTSLPAKMTWYGDTVWLWYGEVDMLTKRVCQFHQVATSKLFQRGVYFTCGMFLLIPYTEVIPLLRFFFMFCDCPVSFASTLSTRSSEPDCRHEYLCHTVLTLVFGARWYFFCSFPAHVRPYINSLRNVQNVRCLSCCASFVPCQLFSDYFGRAPKLNIPGYTFPVEEFYLEVRDGKITDAQHSCQLKPASV